MKAKNKGIDFFSVQMFFNNARISSDKIGVVEKISYYANFRNIPLFTQHPQ